ncbi:hypothetical protein DEO72_LG7g498 [Vigna unguiculata]|uniref:Uncharacterized protein n=1 Tax=Vigna unguiculata TaxID=3917 RepID=A0A4D6ME23_VIGUN|nr:hypothetical protein DEO72_LG7g498 [Vigna unguiculata]
MKKGRQASYSIEDEKNNLKYNFLLEDYLQIQKEYVSKKRKLQAEKRKRDKLVQEVRFLRQKYKHFTETPTARNTQNEEEYIHDVLIEKKMNCVAIETDLQQESNDREEEAVEKSLPMNFSINEKKSKKKVSWDETVIVYNYACMD